MIFAVNAGQAKMLKKEGGGQREQEKNSTCTKPLTTKKMCKKRRIDRRIQFES
jgi:hypothetical protein